MKQKKGMVDIGSKEITARTARAQSVICLGKKSFQALIKGGCPKGDVLETAKVAGVMAAKDTPRMIPYCHPLALNKVHIEFELLEKEFSVRIISEVSCLGRTGVEIEALAAAQTAALTIYDMLKWADKGMVIKETKLLYKAGGKSGDYER